MSERSIWKFSLRIRDEQVIQMPEGAWVLRSPQMDPGNFPATIDIWAEVSPGAPLVDHLFFVRGTGHPLGRAGIDGEWLGTVRDGQFVWHIYDGQER